MPTRFTTEQVVQAVEQHPQRWQHVTRESALSLPVPIGRVGQEGLAFFWYPVGGPIQNRVVGAPTHRVLANLSRLDDITFQPVGPADSASASYRGRRWASRRSVAPWRRAK